MGAVRIEIEPRLTSVKMRQVHVTPLYTSATAVGTVLENASPAVTVEPLCASPLGAAAVGAQAQSASARKKRVSAGSSRQPDASVFPPPNEAEAKEFLGRHAWPRGLQDSLLASCRKIPVRYIIVDDSGSMNMNDGHRVIFSTCNGTSSSSSSSSSGHFDGKMIQCTRWSELSASLAFHAQLAHSAKALTEFSFLNGSAPIVIGMSDDTDGAALEAMLNVSFLLSSFHCV